jgi:NAD(P)-dependent dehydrogenase (short-subunit alcohol dehydrogenase family)
VVALTAQGCGVVLAALPGEPLEEVAAAAEARRVPVLTVPTDITRRSDVDAVVARALVAFGRVDVLINAAGISTRPSLADETDEDLERVVAVNLLGCARTIHAVLPIMKAQRRGSIVSVGSVAGRIGLLGIYSATKFGLRGLCDSVRREVRRFGIHVTLIEPGFVQTEMNARMVNLPPPSIVADAIVDAIHHPRRNVVVPRRYRVAVAFSEALPGFVDAVLSNERIQTRLNRDAMAPEH